MKRPGHTGRIFLGIGAFMTFPGPLLLMVGLSQVVSRTRAALWHEIAALAFLLGCLAALATIAYAVAYVATAPIHPLAKLMWIQGVVFLWSLGAVPAFYWWFIWRDRRSLGRGQSAET